MPWYDGGGSGHDPARADLLPLRTVLALDAAALILFLALTGFEIHGSYSFVGFEQAVRHHAVAAQGLMALIAFAAYWHFTTGEWRHYIPTTRLLRAQCEYYLAGIFTDAPHPTGKSRVSKLNPLQKIVDLHLKVLVIPVLVISGLLYLFYRYPQRHGIEMLDVSGLASIALAHTADAYVLMAFVVAHVYLITTGVTLTSNLKAMMTGYEDAKARAEPREESCATTI